MSNTRRSTRLAEVAMEKEVEKQAREAILKAAMAEKEAKKAARAAEKQVREEKKAQAAKSSTVFEAQSSQFTLAELLQSLTNHLKENPADGDLPVFHVEFGGITKTITITLEEGMAVFE